MAWRIRKKCVANGEDTIRHQPSRRLPQRRFTADDPGVRMPHTIVSYRNDECRSEPRKYFCYACLRWLTPGYE